MMLNASGIKKMFADEVLFSDVSFTLDDNDKVGFVGSNGVGKSTLFKIIAGETEYDEGEIFKNKNARIAYLEQYACDNSEKTVYNEVLESFRDITEIEEKLEDIRLDIERGVGNLPELIRRQNDLNEMFLKRDGAYYKSRLRSALLGLGFSEDEFLLPVRNLSGGQKTRVSLAKILLSDSNVLLLDEPTNHLDINSVNWLEDFLLSFKGAVMVISHDRYFLDRISGRTFELENKKLYSFNGNYSFYVKQKETDIKTREREYENKMREIERLEGIVEQQRRWNREKNIKTAESKMKIIEKLENSLEKPEKKNEDIRFEFKSSIRGADDVVIAQNLSKKFDGKTIFKDASLHITRGERVFLLGANGCGKTTLLKILLGIYEPDGGSFSVGTSIDVGYYDQIQENLNDGNTIIDELWEEYPDFTQTDIRNALAVFLFKGEEVFKEIGKLSGGERARVSLAKLMLKRTNLLILDEPTNHLDIHSREALENALSGYDGTMIAVSHDRYFINKLATRIIHMTDKGVQSYIGNYDDYVRHIIPEEKTEKKQSVNDYLEQKKTAAQKRKIQNRLKRAEEEIEETEDRIKELTKKLESPDISADYVKAMEISEEIGKLNDRLDELYAEWEELQGEDI
ncbi:MAG: ABC-F type ribosomal protection protein [Oscillospiraceae bacterium]|nr:ABC-F type ribosomal protection protein [Oscillospiraceae bacterium]